MDPDDLAYLDAEARAAADFEKHEREVMSDKPTTPPAPIRTAPYLKVVTDNRPTSRLVNRLWPGAYSLALQYDARRAEDEDARLEIDTALRLAVIKGSVDSQITIKPGTIEMIVSALKNIAQHRALRVDA